RFLWSQRWPYTTLFRSLHRLLPILVVELDDERLALCVVEGCGYSRPLARAVDARAGDRVSVAPHRRRQRPSHQADRASREGRLRSEEHTSELQSREHLV